MMMMMMMSFKTKIKSRIVAAEMKFIGKSLGFNWTDLKKINTLILNELKIISATEKINVYESNWTNHNEQNTAYRLL